MALADDPIVLRPVKYRARRVRADATISQISVLIRSQQNAWIHVSGIRKNLPAADRNIACMRNHNCWIRLRAAVCQCPSGAHCSCETAQRQELIEAAA